MTLLNCLLSACSSSEHYCCCWPTKASAYVFGEDVGFGGVFHCTCPYSSCRCFSDPRGQQHIASHTSNTKSSASLLDFRTFLSCCDRMVGLNFRDFSDPPLRVCALVCGFDFFLVVRRAITTAINILHHRHKHGLGSLHCNLHFSMLWRRTGYPVCRISLPIYMCNCDCMELGWNTGQWLLHISKITI